MKAIIADCETTGTSKQDQVIELSYLTTPGDSFFSSIMEVRNDLLKAVDNGISQDNLPFVTFEQRYKPSVDIQVAAYEVHGINQQMLKDCPKSNTLSVPYVEYAVAHNASFDKRMLRQTMDFELHGQFDKINWICTLSLAKIFDKQLKIGYENHKLDTVIKHHFPAHAEKLTLKHHQALNDVVKCALFLTVLVEQVPTIQSWEQLYNFQNMMKKLK